ncbi:class I SAM-dependent methyltransferase [Pseudomaricurvus sp. HS19]|uniref:class I SAM-dependent methyltransferase n=1 Tax=Pseudomaricurvus sp. HS19 TaxID=2692626 RepID=UPI001368BB6D|nr:class I SAM-dependent methyltransferase [Pseudomaricurvus sp. HS19]MYM61992.1 methyltransferase [Pseudomaricurvus sp. HS19]
MSALSDAIKQQLDLLSDDNSDSRRWFHGRGRTFPGFEQVAVDWFDPVLWVTLFKPEETAGLEQQWLREIVELLQTSGSRVAAVLVQRRFAGHSSCECIWGEVPELLYARRGALRFHLQLGERQNTGYFLDMEPGRCWLDGLSKGRRVLNLFSYTCSLSVVAMAAGANSVVNVDMSSAALGQGRDNHRLNDQDLGAVRFLSENILKSWGRIRRQGPYDLVVMDPPSFQKGSFVAQRDYPKLLRRVPELMPAGGDLLLSLNAPELPESFLHDCIAEAALQCEVVGRLPEHPDFPDSDSERRLKLLHVRYRPT